MNGENVSNIIKEMVKSNKIPGAFIFESERCAAVDLLADNLAKTITCADAGYKKTYGAACGVCRSCVKAGKKIHPDIIAPEPEGEGAQSFHINQVRDIIGSLYLAPNESDVKVYIIKDMQNMTNEAQNALLKSLEEPPRFAVFIITVNDGGLLLETVKSRAVRFALDYEGISKKNLTQVYSGLINDILAGSRDAARAAELGKADKAEVINFYTHMENALRDILAAKIFSEGGADISFLYFDNPEEINKITNLYPTKKIFDMAKKIRKYKSDLDYNVNIKLNLASFLSCINV